MWAGVSPDEHLEWRLRELERSVENMEAAVGMFKELAATRGAQQAALQGDVDDLRDDVKSARDGVRQLVLAIVVFSLSVAGSAVALALSLGGH